MIKKFKNMDPITKQFAIAAATHVAIVGAACAAIVITAKKNLEKTETSN